MLVMVALWQYTRAAESVRHRSAHYIAATLAFALAMLAKPSAMMAPVLAFAIDYWLIRRPLREVLRYLAPWCVLAIACAINARIAQPGTGVTRRDLGQALHRRDRWRSTCISSSGHST